MNKQAEEKVKKEIKQVSLAVLTDMSRQSYCVHTKKVAQQTYGLRR